MFRFKVSFVKKVSVEKAVVCASRIAFRQHFLSSFYASFIRYINGYGYDSVIYKQIKACISYHSFFFFFLNCVLN